MKPAIAFGRVMHRRLRPVGHGFAYRVFLLRVPLSRWDEAASRWLSLDRFNLFGWHRADFGPGDGGDLDAWARELLVRHGMDAPGEIVLQAFPRVLGYVFNPLALFLCHGPEGELRAVICEVNNTFGERHRYLVAHADGRPIAGGDELTATKVFHVSPFCRVAGTYRFRFGGPSPGTSLRITYDDGEGPLLVAALHAREEPLGDRALARAFATHPLMTFGVVARIHWQALRLWLRRVPWFPKPPPPLEETSR